MASRSILGHLTFIVPTALVWAVTPASWAFIAYHLVYAKAGPPNRLYTITLYHSLFEAAFSIFLFRLAHKAQKRRRLPGASGEEMRAILLECLEVGISEEVREQGKRVSRSGRKFISAEEVNEESARAARIKFRQWFFDAELEDIKYDNAFEWVAWAMTDCDPSELAAQSSKTALIKEGLEWLQFRLRHTFPSGRNPRVKSIRLSIDPVKTLHRPLGYYVVCCATTFVMYGYLLARGCRFEKYEGCTYLTRDAIKSSRRTDDASLPTFFVHGLGIGLGQYAVFFRHLLDQPQPMAILIQPNISVQIYDSRFLDPPGKLEHVAAFKAICQAKGYRKVTVLSHSNGTMVHSWLLRGAPELCARTILADPVSFRLWEADVCYSFLHKPWNTPLEILLGYFVARELGTAHTIARLFVWTDMMLWEHEIPDTNPSALQIVMGSNDFLIDAPKVVDYLRETGVRDECVTLVRGAPHGAALIAYDEGMKKILASL